VQSGLGLGYLLEEEKLGSLLELDLVLNGLEGEKDLV
jgi:hypothetical protein